MELQHLKKLTIRGHTITPEVAFAFWDILCRMETVEFTRVELKGVSLPVSMTPSNIKSLNLTMMKMTLQQQMDLVEKCTGLECLRLEGEIPEDAIANCLQRATLQHLHHINLSRILLGNDCLQKILGSVTKLTVLDINCSKWGFESVNALSNHFESLEIFRLPSKLPFDPLTSILVSRVMSSCPNLKTLNASVVKGLDIINASLAKEIGKPDIGWACTRLTHLGLRFDLTDLESQKPIVELIGSLTLIKELDISTHYSFALPSIRFSLSHGLDDLKSLKNLTRLVVTGTKQESNVEDMNWMIENWRKLESVIGNFHENNRCREKLKGVLKYNRLKVF
ncbi:hypothetical protein BGZ76_005827 [Entomortierella beljakovae]|nr:hypothetical protein BGZ76_005827 [Entomortierella beljakovae]